MFSPPSSNATAKANATVYVTPPPPATANATVYVKPPPPSPPSPSPQPSGGEIVGIGVGAGVILLVAVVVMVCLYKHRRNQRENPALSLEHGRQTQKSPCNAPSPVNDIVHQHSMYDRIPPIIQSPLQKDSVVSRSPLLDGIDPKPFSISTFTYEELELATDNFSDANLLGRGGFGYVHKGLLPDGKEIAVKQLKGGSNQGKGEFKAEVEIISRVHHRHLVSLVGYCIFEEMRMLVYDFIPNKTLEFHLHGEGRPPMNWASRLKIALGAAKGLAYLHEDCDPKIIHRDVKAANILLNNDFEAKVADFGLAKFFPDTSTHVSTMVKGTYGYLDPEYASSGKLTDKSDVFSFGVVLLELITGRRPIVETRHFTINIVEWAWPKLRQAIQGGDLSDLVDQRMKNYRHFEMDQMVACAAVCVHRSAKQRPQMSQVVRALEGNMSAKDLLKETAPYNDCNAQYKEDMNKFWNLALN